MAVSDSIAVGVPPQIFGLVQQGLLERAFHDGLFPALLYRSEAQSEEWVANTGTEIFMTRPGLLPPITKPLVAGVDPTPQVINYEQWAAVLQRFGGTIDTHMPTSAVSSQDQFLRNIQQLGLQAGQSLNRIPRNSIFQAYLSGQTNLTSAIAAVDTAISVASLNGFLDVILLGGASVRPQPVSTVAPLPIFLDPDTLNIARNVIAAIPDNPDDPLGPGTLLLDAAVGSIIAIRGVVQSAFKPDVIRVGGASSVDGIVAGNIFDLQTAINTTNRLRKQNIMPHEDGYFHAHISPDANSQIFEDNAWQRLNQSLPDHVYYQQAFIGTMGGIAFFLNNESPDRTNSGDTTSTGPGSALYSEDIGAETVNEAGIDIGRILVTGRGAMYEKSLNEDVYVTEAGITGKEGSFNITNQGVNIETQGIKLILRAPINRTQDQVAATWTISTSFPIPSDQTAPGGSQRFRRAVIVEHASAA